MAEWAKLGGNTEPKHKVRKGTREALLDWDREIINLFSTNAAEMTARFGSIVLDQQHNVESTSSAASTTSDKAAAFLLAIESDERADGLGKLRRQAVNVEREEGGSRLCPGDRSLDAVQGVTS